jgi:hypothetical protein
VEDEVEENDKVETRKPGKQNTKERKRENQETKEMGPGGEEARKLWKNYTNKRVQK